MSSEVRVMDVGGRRSMISARIFLFISCGSFSFVSNFNDTDGEYGRWETE